MTSHPTIRLGVDIGGTFTDVALEVGEARFTAKILTTPSAPEDGVLAAVRQVTATAGVEPGAVGLIIHGTTLATNALIERKGAKTALLTTEGFRDVVEIRHENRFEQYDVNIDLPPPLVPRRLRLPVRERIDAQGSVLTPLDESSVAGAIEILAAEQVETVAVGFLHSFTNPEHERRVGAALAQRLPNVPVTLSCEVSPEMREYERFSTACANAYLQPLIGRYLGKLEQLLAGADFACPLLLMTSGGGIMTLDTAIRFPVRLVESGPAGGAIFASCIARQHGLDQVVSFDMVHAIESGKDLRARTLIAFGGAAPLHATRVAEKLGINRVLVPANAGVGSAIGLLRAPVAYEIVRGRLMRLGSFDAAAANRLCAEMHAEAETIVRRGAPAAELTGQRSAFMRYRGQGHEIAVTLPVREFTAQDRSTIADLFEAAYRRLYSRAIPGVEIEILSWVVAVSAPPEGRLAAASEERPSDPRPRALRPVFNPGVGELRETPVYWRAELAPGACIKGPAIIAEDETSTVISPQFDARIDRFGYIELTRR